MIRLIAVLFAALLAASPATAQSWKEYDYPQYAFSVSFPASPTVESRQYQTADGSMVDARVYELTRDNFVLRMTVADLTAKKTDEETVIGHAVKTLKADGDIKVDIPHRISRVYGRQLSISGKDGRHSSVAVFYHQNRLYQIEGVALPKGQDGTADAIRFQQSLSFTSNSGALRSRLGPLLQTVSRVFQ